MAPAARCLAEMARRPPGTHPYRGGSVSKELKDVTWNPSPTAHTAPVGERHLPHRRAWQVAFSSVALIPTSAALWTYAQGVERFVEPADVDVALDSTYRYYGGVYFAVALLVWWSLPRIEQRAPYLVFAAGAIFLGGMGRIVSIVQHGAPATATWFVLVLELGAVVAAAVMQRSVRDSSP